MDILKNIDLLSVGFAIAATGVLGFLVYFSNTKSSTNRTFLYFSLVTIAWSLVNYFNYQLINPVYGLLLIRMTIFLGIFHAFSFFELFSIFPKEQYTRSRFHTFFVIPWVFIMALLTLTPYVFKGVSEIQNGRIVEVVNGPLLPLYGITTISLIVLGIIRIIKKFIGSKGPLRSQTKVIFFGTAITFALLIVFNFVFPAVLNISKYIPFGALFLFPFISFTSYAILKHKLFRIKVLSTGVTVFILSTVLLFELIYTQTLSMIFFRGGVFLLMLIFGINLIRSVLREVEQREHIQTLAGELQQANEKLKGLDKLKTEFLSLASHQLRSPLTAIKGYASMLTEGAFGALDEKQNEAVKRIYASAQGLVNVVEDLLNVSKIEQGGMKYEFSPVDLQKLITDLVGEMRIPAENKKLIFTAVIPQFDKCMVNADPVKIKQVFLNLVDNSIKYTEKGFVEVSLTRSTENKTIIFTVRDSGVGISQETKEKLFQKFSRGEGGKLNTGGSGLGLYLAREIARAHKGDITITSEGLGKGASFIVTLPAVGAAGEGFGIPS